uniref:m7GpppN-mRNA hydrolase n=2 Tax=Cacopsylla melanoneura TaxID=428564 RepID=A0A8D9BUW4_9HEMI
MDKIKDKTYYIRRDILDDLCSRFVINIPHEERGDVIRICFQMELAYWFYLDFYCSEDDTLVKTGLKDFFFQMFHHIPSLTHFAHRIDQVLDDWRHYKMSVPTFGAILIDESLSQVLLVQSFFAKASWGFPKGKVNQDELPINCAIREVLEETGFDSSRLISEDSYLESTYNDQLTRLYLIPGVPFDFKFSPKTRNEIKSCQWFPIGELPSSRKEVKTVNINGLTLGTNAFFMIRPFIKRIKRFVHEQLKLRAQLRSKVRHKSVSEVQNPSGSRVRGPVLPAQPVRCMDLEEAMLDNSQKGRLGQPGGSVKKRLFNPGPMDNYSLTPLDPLPSHHRSRSPPLSIQIKKTSPLTPKSQPQTTQYNPYYPKQWREFQFDVEAIMACFS